MDQASDVPSIIFFFIISCKILGKNPFLTFLSPSQQPIVFFSIYQNNTWTIRRLVNEMIDPATQHIILKIVKFLLSTLMSVQPKSSYNKGTYINDVQFLRSFLTPYIFVESPCHCQVSKSIMKSFLFTPEYPKYLHWLHYSWTLNFQFDLSLLSTLEPNSFSSYIQIFIQPRGMKIIIWLLRIWP